MGGIYITTILIEQLQSWIVVIAIKTTASLTRTHTLSQVVVDDEYFLSIGSVYVSSLFHQNTYNKYQLIMNICGAHYRAYTLWHVHI